MNIGRQVGLRALLGLGQCLRQQRKIFLRTLDAVKRSFKIVGQRHRLRRRRQASTILQHFQQLFKGISSARDRTPKCRTIKRLHLPTLVTMPVVASLCTCRGIPATSAPCTTVETFCLQECETLVTLRLLRRGVHWGGLLPGGMGWGGPGCLLERCFVRALRFGQQV